ncbi:phosphoglycerate mutase [Silvimonas iriomotensis]|uniref:Phosphoglycerate mutase n=2 Tax=Silvimonas iriomotensis TaxID=449662 RepID=A0ABQ2PEZ5_9NEIS|nr:phosphoglycerate mutase [Silvimonas iriomotensis]
MPVQDATGLCYGRLDLPLAQSPAAHDIEALQARLPAGAPVYSSPLARCWQVAQQLAPAAVADARLQELDFGQWEGRAWQDIGPAALDDWIASGYAATHGGESLAALQARVWQWADELAASHVETAIVVTHAGVIRALWSRMLPWDQCLQRPVPHGEILWITWPQAAPVAP